MRLVVRLTPRAGRDRIEGWGRDDAGRAFLKVGVAAPPVNGQANEALTRLIAKALGCAPGRVTIAAGQSARTKQLEINGADVADLARAFGAPPF